MLVKGNCIDTETRCVHYNSPLDIIAIKFKCCNDYYPCYECHKAATNHELIKWEKNEFNQKAILCGKCSVELTIQEYMESNHRCPACQSAFNPGCSKHYDLYFNI